MGTPNSFIARVLEFHYFGGKIRTGVGRVEHQDHPFNNKFVAFCVRDGMGTMTYDLKANPAEYNLCIGDERPNILIDPINLAMPEWMQFKSVSFFSGLGYITKSVISLDEIYKQRVVKRPSQNG